jgi:hypothetical protein
MSVAVGQLLAFIKMGSIALVIIAVVGLIVRHIEKRGREKSDGDKK